MALTPSEMIELGTKAPDFTLVDVNTQKLTRFSDIKGPKGTLVMFICAHCPYVIHIQNELARLAHDYFDKGIGFVAISANDIEKYPQDHPNELARQAQSQGFIFPYLFDETQITAKAYHAACTPDFFLFDGQDACVYRGRLDESRPKNDIPVTGKDMRDAIDRLLSGKKLIENQYPSMGCNIKWKA